MWVHSFNSFLPHLIPSDVVFGPLALPPSLRAVASAFFSLSRWAFAAPIPFRFRAVMSALSLALRLPFQKVESVPLSRLLLSLDPKRMFTPWQSYMRILTQM